tara:strand:+ start:4415 stop:4600 length:186 start_codon:yes stop_codon:yes gene_type:complete
MRYFNVWYIPHDKLLNTDNPNLHTQWMIVMADHKGNAKNLAKQNGLVTLVTPLNKNKKTVF